MYWLVIPRCCVVLRARTVLLFSRLYAISDISLQDPVANPQAVVKTTALTATLPRCGESCCPFGYSCDGNVNCVEDEDQLQKPLAAVLSSSTAAPPSSTATQSSVSSLLSSTSISTSVSHYSLS
ncbi:hypothetical protein F5Y09DRAFT_297639 [Xylaria sp. FL1042]|nr:hypothetical protein F5Y09DRAFT_297639 [Xylaria sp. FL1042]